jgi:hypothetical protein
MMEWSSTFFCVRANVNHYLEIGTIFLSAGSKKAAYDPFHIVDDCDSTHNHPTISMGLVLLTCPSCVKNFGSDQLKEYGVCLGTKPSPHGTNVTGGSGGFFLQIQKVDFCLEKQAVCVWLTLFALSASPNELAGSGNYF